MIKISINKENLIRSVKKNYIDFSIPAVAHLYAHYLGLDFKLEWHRHFVEFVMYIFPFLIVIKIIFDAIKMGREDSK